MREFLISIFVNIIALLIIDNFSSSINFRGGLKSVLVLAIIMTLLNSTVRPVLQALSIPITIITLGLFYFVVNGFVLVLAFSLTSGAKINGLWAGIWVSIVISILTSLLNKIFLN